MATLTMCDLHDNCVLRDGEHVHAPKTVARTQSPPAELACAVAEPKTDAAFYEVDLEATPAISEPVRRDWRLIGYRAATAVALVLATFTTIRPYL